MQDKIIKEDMNIYSCAFYVYTHTHIKGEPFFF